MEIITTKKIPRDIKDSLSKIIASPKMYPEFPEIPQGIFLTDGNLQEGLSLYKKGGAYFVLDDGKGEYREGMDVLDISMLIFNFTQYELESPHVGDTIRNRVQNIVEGGELLLFEQAIETVISKKLFEKLSEYFGSVLSLKLYELSHLIGDTDFSYLARISLVPYNGVYIVLDAEIDFTRQELEQIKRAVFI